MAPAALMMMFCGMLKIVTACGFSMPAKANLENWFLNWLAKLPTKFLKPKFSNCLPLDLNNFGQTWWVNLLEAYLKKMAAVIRYKTS